MESIGPLMATALRELGLRRAGSGGCRKKVRGGIRQREEVRSVACCSMRSLAVIASGDPTHWIACPLQCRLGVNRVSLVAYRRLPLYP
jgi:hypothetical protein